ncbi:Uncharacterised protein [Enterobacter cloacae]|nr:Uncharacterised protein [Enterobacter cloacae]
MIAAPATNFESSRFIHICILYMDMRLHFFVPIWLECSYKIRFIFNTEIPKYKMEADITRWFALIRSVPVRIIESRISLILTGKKSAERIDYCTFSYVIWAYKYI